MLTKSMIAIAAVLASLVTLSASQAEAHKADINTGLPVANGFYGVGYGPHPAAGAYHRAPRYVGINCGQARNVVWGNGFYNVTALDCSAPSFKFVAWQRGNPYRVRVNNLGNITGVAPL